MSSTTLHIPETLKKWQSEFELLESFMGDSWGDLAGAKRSAMAEFLEKGFPTTRWEEWKYTSVAGLLERENKPVFRLPGHDIDPLAGHLYDAHLPAGLACHLVVLVNGHFDAGLSRIREDDGLRIKSLREALADGSAAEHFDQVAPHADSPFVALNTAMVVDGVFIHLERGQTSKFPVYVLHLGYNGSGEEIASHSRKLVVVEENAHLKLIENWVQWTEGDTFENHVSEIVLGRNAGMELYTVQDEERIRLIDFTQVRQDQGSRFQSLAASLSGKLVRNNLHVLHRGEHCETHLYGLYLLDGQAHVDNHTLVDHAQPNCFSNELYKGVLDGNSTAVFNGKVMVRPDAQKTNAFQSNKTILLSEGATINTKPQLEIFADDVKCSHGATTGRLDKTALFYLRSRGLSEASARALLTYAFAAEVLEAATIPELKEHLTQLVRTRLFDH